MPPPVPAGLRPPAPRPLIGGLFLGEIALLLPGPPIIPLNREIGGANGLTAYGYLVGGIAVFAIYSDLRRSRLVITSSAAALAAFWELMS
jgi:hypothetical protein